MYVDASKSPRVPAGYAIPHMLALDSHPRGRVSYAPRVRAALGVPVALPRSPSCGSSPAAAGPPHRPALTARRDTSRRQPGTAGLQRQGTPTRRRTFRAACPVWHAPAVPDAPALAAELLARLRGAAIPPLLQPPGEACPHPTEAGTRWAAALQLVPGPYPTPPAALLVPLAEEWCAARGWPVAPTHRQLGASLRAHGLRPVQRNRWRGYGVTQAQAGALWRQAEALHPHGLPETHPGREKPNRRRTGPRAPPPLLGDWPPGVRLLDSLGRVWPSGAYVAVRLRCHPRSLSEAMRNGWALRGCYWRRLTPQEVALLPTTTRAGDKAPLCFHSPCLDPGHALPHTVP
jgi:hypothetical protein